MTSRFATRRDAAPGLVGPGRAPSRHRDGVRGGRAARMLLHALLDRIGDGELLVSDPLGTRRFGRPGASQRAEIRVSDLAAYRAVAREGSIGLGRAYLNGTWHADDLVTVLRVLTRNLGPLDDVARRAHQVRTRLPGRGRPRRSRGADRDRDHVHAHYDLGNEFFRLFLDDTMSYSCAYFDGPGTSLLEAQVAKLDRLCRKLELDSDDHVVEIGTGWGGFALHAAGRYGCRVTTTTVSAEQYAYATKKVAEAGLADQVTVLDCDYRELSGRYDKLVSVEMIEAVDWRDHEAYFATCAGLLEPDGIMALQAITIGDQWYELRKDRADFIKRFIFPGGCLPSVARMTDVTARVTDLVPVHLEDIGPHYAETLRRWRARFLEAEREVADLGLDDRFRRMWEFYLALCEAGFRERRISDVQLVLAKPAWRGNI